MSQNGPLRQQMIDRFEEMSPQLQQAARHLINHPQEVALISMRELARNAGVQPATMTRLAKFLGASGYDDLRNEQADSIRSGSPGLIARAMQNRPRPGDDSPEGQAGQMLLQLGQQVAQLAQPENLIRITRAADALTAARRIFVLGMRSCHSVAWQFHYVMSLLGDKSVHLDGAGGTGADALIRADDQDALLVISVSPYARHSLEVSALAQQRGLTVIAITDSEVAPMSQQADHLLICPVEGHRFFHSLTPAMALSEVLCGLLARADPKGALSALARFDAQQNILDTYANAITPRPLG